MAYAAVLGMRTEAKLQGQQYSWLGSIFYFGYLLMQLPNYWILIKVPLGRFIGVMAICWGGCTCLMAACHNFAGLAALRFLLGIFEAAIMPTFMILTAIWYKREEQPLRTALWYNTFAGVCQSGSLGIREAYETTGFRGYTQLCNRQDRWTSIDLESKFRA